LKVQKNSGVKKYFLHISSCLSGFQTSDVSQLFIKPRENQATFMGYVLIFEEWHKGYQPRWVLHTA